MQVPTYAEFAARMDDGPESYGLRVYYDELIASGLPPERWSEHAFATLAEYSGLPHDVPRWYGAYNVASNWTM